MWINTLRVNEIKCMLEDSSYDNIPLVEIAYKTGYFDLPAMSKTFKKIVGCNPSEYRSKFNISK